MTAITRRRGDTYADEITVTDSAGTVIDITGYTFAMTLDPSKAPVDAMANLYSITGTILNATAGRVEFAPTPTQADQAPGTYFYDVQMVDGAGRKRTIALDKYVYSQDITKG